MPFLTLLGACLLRVPVLLSVILLVGLVVLGVESGEAGVLGGIVPILIGLSRAVFSPLLAYANLSVAVSPDGLRLRYGLVETRMQTVPPHRVQAARVVEPVLWQVFGWARLEANVAGYVGDRQMATAMLLPAAPRRLVFTLVGWVFPGTDLGKLRLLPARARPAGYAAGADETVFVSRRGLICRTLEIVAHARVQSVQLTMAPWQRRRRVATVHIDTPPGPVHVQAPGRDAVEARVIVESIAERSRRARAGSQRPEHWAVQPPRPPA